MKKGIIIFVVVAIVLLLCGAIFTMVLPSLSLLDNGTNTISKTHGGVIGNKDYELIGPKDRKGFICSYMDNGLSETITCRGRLTGEVNFPGMYKVKYLVYLKENEWSDYELVSKPGDGGTSMYLSNPNPGNFDPEYGYLKNYEFEIMGKKYSNGAVKVELWGLIDETIWDTTGKEWKRFAIDEAYLFQGWGGLYLPRDEDDRPRSTFAIGETVNINVKTSYGGQAVGEGKTWRVCLKYPASRGGEVFKQQDYGDNANAYFTFTVSDDMFELGGDNTWQLEIYNTLIPKGTLSVDTIDILGKAPNDVSFEGAEQAKIGESTSVLLKTSVNSDTQLPIDHFKISVVYGTSDALLPSDPNSHKWIIHTTDIPANLYGSGEYRATISFKPTVESYVTVHAKAYDTEGRSSIHSRYFTLWAYEDNPVPDEVIQDEIGEGDYGGGHTDPWYSWDPAGGNWEVNGFEINTVGIIVSILIFAGFLLAGILIPGINKPIRIALIIIGIALSIISYLLFFM